MKKQDIKPFVWGTAIGAIGLLIVIFSAGWVVTSGSAQSEMKLASSSAVLNRLVPIAIAQFQGDPNKEVRLAEMKKLDSWGTNNRSEYIKKQGWATMPGDKDPDNMVADECARRLMELKL